MYKLRVVVRQMDTQTTHLEAQAARALGEENQKVQNGEYQTQEGSVQPNGTKRGRGVIETNAKTRYMEMQAGEQSVQL